MISEAMKESLRDAVAAVRQFGEPVEIYWHRDEPYDETLHGSWSGNLESLKTLRKWLAKHEPDGRRICVYCRGDFKAIRFV